VSTSQAQAPKVNIDDDDDGLELPRVEVNGEVVEGDEIVPGEFTYFDADGEEHEYDYDGDGNYRVRRWSDDHHAWICSRDRIGDEETVETFLAIKRAEAVTY
jgi:YD repeat-containing protein